MMPKVETDADAALNLEIEVLVKSMTSVILTVETLTLMLSAIAEARIK